MVASSWLEKLQEIGGVEPGRVWFKKGRQWTAGILSGGADFWRLGPIPGDYPGLEVVNLTGHIRQHFCCCSLKNGGKIFFFFL